MIRVMRVPASGLPRLGWFVQQARVNKRWSQSRAAKEAGVSRPTWVAIEDATSEAQDTTLAGVEDALGWVRGSANAIRDGGTPTTTRPDGEPLTQEERVLATIAALNDPRIDWGDEDLRQLMLAKATGILERIRRNPERDTKALG
jgi:hypothetical protein